MNNNYIRNILLVGFFALNIVLIPSNTVDAASCAISKSNTDMFLCNPRMSDSTRPPGCTITGVTANEMLCPGIPSGYDTKPTGVVTVEPPTVEKGGNFTLSWSYVSIGEHSEDCQIAGKTVPTSSGSWTGPSLNNVGTYNYILSCKAWNGTSLSGDYIPISSTQITITDPAAETPPLTELVNTNLGYVPLEPLVGVNQGGDSSFGALIKGYFRILVNIGAFLAVVVLVVGGITYMVSESVATKFVGKERVKAAFIGLGILGAAWLILNTINPQLLTFDKDFLAPAGPSVVERTADLDKDGVAERELTGNQMKRLREHYKCPPKTGVQCVADKVLIFDPEKKNTPAVKKAIAAYEKYCRTDAILWNFAGWGIKHDISSKNMFGVSGMTVHTCTRPVLALST